MADKPEETAQPVPGLVRQIPVVYFNAAEALSKEFEVTIDLAFRAGGQQPEVAARIVTTWEHAKSVRDLLDRMITRYEESVGQIREFNHEGTRDQAQKEGAG